MDERKKILRMIREMRTRLSPEILALAEDAACKSIGVVRKEPENEASRLFKLATAQGGKRRAEILTLLERRFAKKLH